MASGRHIDTIVILLLFGLYLVTSCPTIYLGDSGELVTAAYGLGIAHPLGFPFYALLAKCATLLPLGDIAWRINLLSALGAVCSAGGLAVVVRRLSGGDRGAARFAALLFGASATLWAQGVIARTYTICAAFAVLLLLVVTGEEEERSALLFPFLLGVSVAHHLLTIVLAPLFLSRRSLWSPRRLGVKVAFFLLGFSLYLYLPLRAGRGVLLDWGDPDGWGRFVAVMTQAQYRQKIFSPDLAPRIEMARIIGGAFTSEFVAPLIPVAPQEGVRAWFARGVYWTSRGIVLLLLLSGFGRLWRRRRWLAAGIALAIVGNATLKMSYYGVWELNQVLRYLLPAFLLAALCIGLGYARLLGGERRSLRRTLLSLLLLFPLIVGNFFRQDRSRHFLARDRIADILASLPEEAVVLVSGDNEIFPAWYLQRVEKFREDVAVIPRSAWQAGWLIEDVATRSTAPGWPERLDLRRRGEAIPAYLEGIVEGGERPVFTLFEDTNDPTLRKVFERWHEKFRFDPYGLAFRIVRKEAPERDLLAENIAIFRNYRLAGLATLPHDPHTVSSLHRYAAAFNRVGLLAMAAGRLEVARAWFERAVALGLDDPSPRINLATAVLRSGALNRGIEILEGIVRETPGVWEAYFNLGAAYLAAGEREKAREAFQAVLAARPDHPEAAAYLERIETMADPDEETQRKEEDLEGIVPTRRRPHPD